MDQDFGPRPGRSLMRAPNLLALAMLWSGVAAAQPWIPSECGTRHEKLRSDFARALREAKPGAALYVPKPFPKTGAEVIEDFKYGYRKMVGGWNVSKDQALLLRGIKKNAVSFRILRVENWTPNRCGPDQQMDFYYLLYITDTRTGREVGRGSLNQSGLIRGWGASPTSEQEDEPWGALYRAAVAPRLDSALAEVRVRYGISGTKPQYVATWGQPQCPVVAPCVAFQSKGRSYLFARGELVEISSSSRSYSRTEMEATRTRRFEITSSINPDKEWLVSIAADRWVLATRVKPIR
jgi:hypothetical protein